VLEAMAQDSGITLSALRTDGGMVVNELLMQFQADILGIPVQRPVIKETTALGAAYAAGLAVGFYGGLEELRENWSVEATWEPGMVEGRRAELYREWKKAVTRSFAWVDG
jgi:glycerol kinase